ncbi:MAG TPA: DUF932 domain-containing protein [Steroidobacteraceae bacterium]|nr:DUF932 domain-containing protein [Steroidobacteraceae bacterium]
MSTSPDLSFGAHVNVFGRTLSLEAVRQQAPAVFAPSADERRSLKYTFIPTAQILAGLGQAGFVPVEARQTATRSASPLHARHVVRLRRRFETVQLRDSIPEIVFLNSHDGSSAYQLRVGLFRVVCTNGLIVSRGAFPTFSVAHRGNVVEDVVAHALGISERFDALATQVECMERRRLAEDEQIRFAEQALALRFPDRALAGLAASQLLNCRRVEDAGDDLFSILNRVQENLLRGGLNRRSGSGRLVQMRRITSIRQDMRINSALWEAAAQML